MTVLSRAAVGDGWARRRPPGRPRATAPRRTLLAVCLAVVLARLPSVWQPLRNDEGGYLLAARHWHAGGEFLYGDLFVDRPPLLLAIFRVAALSGWDGAIRLLAIPFAVVFVVAAWHAGARLGGPAGARWAAVVGAGLVCSPALAADQADGELFATVLVMASVACALAAWAAGSPGRAAAVGALAGALAAGALLVKQSALEGVVVVAVLVAVGAWRGGPARRRALALAASAGAGALLATAAALVPLVASGTDAGTLWRDLVGMRGDALDVIWSARPHATLVRAGQLVALTVVTGLAGAVATWCWAAGRDRALRRSAEGLAVLAMVPAGLAAMVAGGSFWPSYALQLAPVAALSVGALAGRRDRAGTWARRWGRVVVVTAVVAAVGATVVYATVPRVWFQQRIGEWLAASAEPGDTAVVAYGHPSILAAADLTTPYPYLWSVPMRTLDGDQALLRATLAGPDAPAWLVAVNGWNSWGIDDDGRLRDLLADRYRVVAQVCGRPVLLREDLQRSLAPPVRC
ncbi:hypothetical protein [uncultured Cellulomonas sp.]|uniref:hypothetical protein n=1 Tax=uncultured Cellulomonas sp. TaxID=189682 RepID=UPI002633EE18|nr:hypothetical protein [uncultured Cellulomonas sp.]